MFGSVTSVRVVSASRGQPGAGIYGDSTVDQPVFPFALVPLCRALVALLSFSCGHHRERAYPQLIYLQLSALSALSASTCYSMEPRKQLSQLSRPSATHVVRCITGGAQCPGCSAPRSSRYAHGRREWNGALQHGKLGLELHHCVHHPATLRVHLRRLLLHFARFLRHIPWSSSSTLRRHTRP